MVMLFIACQKVFTELGIMPFLSLLILEICVFYIVSLDVSVIGTLGFQQGNHTKSRRNTRKFMKKV